MASKAFSVQFLNSPLEYLDFASVFPTVILAGFIAFIIVAVKCMLWRRNVSHHLPGKKIGVFDVMGSLSDFSYRAISRIPVPLNAYVLQTLTANAELFRKRKLYCFWMSYVPFIILVKAEAVEALLSGTKMIEKSREYEFMHPWLGTGLLTSWGSKWKSRRKLLTPCFNFEILKEFLPIFYEQAQILVKRLRSETHKDYTDIVTPVSLCSLDIICETTMGVSIGAQENGESQYVKSISSITDIIMERMGLIHMWPDIIFGFTKSGKQFKKDLKIIHNFSRFVIQEKKNKLLNGKSETIPSKRKALLDLLLEHHLRTGTLSEEDIREEVDTFTFEGFETTAMGMVWALYLIGLHQDVQAAIHEEIDRIFGNDFDRPFTIDDLNDMKYLECVLKESQRLNPSIPIMGRKGTEEFQICGYTIPKGASYFILPYSLHRDEDVFPNPEKFDPDRFLPENSLNRHPYAYVPFSAGPRNCIGQRFAVMEEKVVLSTILWNYTLKSLDQRDKISPSAELALKPQIPIRIQIRKRHANKP